MWTMHRWLLVVRGAATRVGRRGSHNVMRGENSRRDQRPKEQRGCNESFQRDGKRESLSAEPACSLACGGIVIHQAFGQTSEIAHGHTSTHDGWQPFCKSAFFSPFYDFVAPVFRPAGL
jgi:hypothetical protein